MINSAEQQERKKTKMTKWYRTSFLLVPIHQQDISLGLATHPNYVVYQQMPLSHQFRHIQALYQNHPDAKRNEKN
jgi:predicted phosphoribosyltransferase